MPLAAGQILSFYEILGPLGAGGMGEVYLAKDTRLDREVAIKVLPEGLAHDEERLRRFEREAKTLASLNHPNLAGIHGVDQDGDVFFLALELVPGEDLATKLSRGPLPVDEAIDVCRQIAEGLEAAHEAGVIHRDLKPANVRVTPAGIVKLLDFGLAKPIRPEGSTGHASSAQSDSFLVTSEGMILGTPTYMSPEQARGKLLDRRTDIWAFGCVLYECLSGRRAFAGDAFGDLIASILSDEVDLGALPSGTPPRLRELIARCLIKDPRRRLRDVGDARIELEGMLAGDFGNGSPAPLEPASPPGKRALAWPLAALALTVLAFVLGRGQGSDKEASDLASPALATPGEVRFPVALPTNTELLKLAVSADGSTLALVLEDLAKDTGVVYIRRLDGSSLQRLPETEGVWTDGGGGVALSPSGDALAFISGTQLYTLNIKTRVKTPLATCENTRGTPSWGTDGEILFTGEYSQPLFQVSAKGGVARPVTEVSEERGELYHRSPTWLADGSGFLAQVFYSAPRNGGAMGRHPGLALFRPGEVPIPLCSSDAAGSIAGDWLIWLSGSRLLAQAFDEQDGVLSGAEQVVADGLGEIGTRPAAASYSGVVAYQRGHSGEEGTSMGWVDLSSGTADTGDIETVGWPARNLDPIPSPIDDRIVVSITDLETGGDIWIFGPDQAPRQITDGELAHMPAWSPDGTRIAYSSYTWSDGRRVTRAYIRAADGSGEREEIPGASLVYAWSPDGNWLAFEALDGKRAIRFRWVGDDTGMDAAESPDTEDRYLQDSKGKLIISLCFSPDGKWIAYQEGLYDNAEVFIRPFAKGLGSRQSVSRGQGAYPDWSPTAPAAAPELLYSRGHQSVMRVTLEPADTEGSSFRPSRPEELLRMRHFLWNRGCIYSHDGKRILVNRKPMPNPNPVTVIVGWKPKLAEK